MRTILLAALAFTLTAPAAALAGPGHSAGHGHAHGHGGAAVPYEGHAAALGEPGDPKAKARTVSVTMTEEMRFQPALIHVTRGETIRFVVKNAGKAKHEMTLGTMEELLEHAAVMEKHPEMEHDDPNAVTVEPGKSKTILWKFTRSGSFDYGCLIPGHLGGGMKGRIVVR